MNESQNQLLSATREFATDIFLNKVSKSLRYHNLDHTQRVVLACEEMADFHQLQPADREVLLVAAWFHDIGFSEGVSKGHEDAGIRIATAFLRERKADEGFISKVANCIKATEMPQSPKNLVEQILCDADLFHLGTDEFKSKNELLRQEMQDFGKEDVPKKKWRKINIAFMESQKYFTDYAKRKLQPVKEKHISELKGKDKDKNKQDGKKKRKEENDLVTVFGADVVKDPDEVKKKQTKEKDKDKETERGISTVFRIMANNHATLSQMADNKANIMISVNSIILSVIVSVLVRHLDESPNLVIPTIMLVLVCVTTIVYAVRATRPNISEGKFTEEDIQNKKTNLLFFGNFHNMTLPDYDWAMKEMLNSREYLYGSMVKDVYFLGVVLAKKYKLLRISYNVFMFGLIITMLAYGVAIGYESVFVETTVKTIPVTP